jgi:WD repeat-containing protein 68
MAWCKRQNEKFKMAIGSFKELYSNQIEIIQLRKDSDNVGQFKKLCEFDHPYPPTKLMFAPAQHNLGVKDILATTGDYLRIWNIDSDNQVEMKSILNNNKHTGKSWL